MLLNYEQEAIVTIFQKNLECTIILVSQFTTIYDMKITKVTGKYGIEFSMPGSPAYIISEHSLADEISKLARDYHEYKVLSTYSSPYYGESTYCSHDWVNVGFHWDKWVCKKCNKDKE